MNREYLLEYYRDRFQHYSELWNKTSEDRYLQEALNYQAEIEKLEKQESESV